MALGFYFDMTSCFGCRTCQVACKDKNDLEIGVVFRNVTCREVGTFPTPGAFHFSATCNHCENPMCVANCPSGAMYKTEEGPVLHDDELCMGCGTCVEACPYQVPKMLETGKAGKCDTCIGLRANGNNPACVDAALQDLDKPFNGLLFVNLVDTDSVYGHRRDVKGYGEALEYFDRRLPEFTAKMTEEDLLIITADHGCDPTWHGTDHTREYVPILVWKKGMTGHHPLGTRSTYADMAATIADFFGLEERFGAVSFLHEIEAGPGKAMQRIQRAADVIENTLGRADVAVVLGSGLGDFGKELKNARELSYADVPDFPRSTVAGHAGKFILGELGGKKVLLMSGRFHSYEGHPMEDVTLPVRVMRRLGIEKLILTNAAGGVNTDLRPGTLMLLADFINLSGKNPLTGPNLDAFGPRFPDMTNAFDRGMRTIARMAAAELGIDLRSGVYCWMNGPTYETPAEIRMARTLGADAVGMSTVPETIVARHCGMKVLGISCITNMAAGVLDEPINHQEVMEMGRRVRGDFAALLTRVIEQL